MEMAEIADVLREAVSVVIRIGGPILLLSMAVGVLTAILQAVTQIHEQTISFMMKLLVVILVLVIGGGWMLQNLQDFALRLYSLM